jgi:hypothetical protein
MEHHPLQAHITIDGQWMADAALLESWLGFGAWLELWLMLGVTDGGTQEIICRWPSRRVSQLHHI